MNLLTKRLLLLTLITISFLSLKAQKTTFENVLSMRLHNMGPIVENDQVKGYFMFYKVDKVDRKNNAYLLRLLDENLKEVNKKRFVKSKYISLTEVVYNNEAFLFSFLDRKKKILGLESYDKTMKKLGSRSYKLDKWGMQQYRTELGNNGKGMEEGSNKMIFPMKKKGFIRYTTKKNRKVGYELEFLPNDLSKSDSWSDKSPEESKVMLSATFGDISDKYLVSAITVKPKLLSNKKVSFNLKVVDLKQKTIAFEKEMKNDKYIYSFMNAFINEELKRIIVFGEYFNLGDKIFSSKSKGLAVLEYDLKGNVLRKEHHGWSKSIGKKIAVNKKGKLESGGYIAFHKVMNTSDGHFYVIGELYKKSINTIGIAANMLSAAGNSRGQNSVVKMVVKDLIVFDFNSDLSLNDATIIEKRRSNVGVPQGSVYLPPTLLANFIRLYGGFDYSFTQMNKDNSTFFSTYSAIEKVKGKRKPYFGIIAKTIGEKEYSLDRIDLKTEASKIYVSPAKPGYILLTEYFRKQKRLESRLEKINY